MKQTFTTVLSIFLLLLFSSCADNSVNESDSDASETQPIELQADELDSLRMLGKQYKSNAVPTTQSINSDDYQIVFRDRYGDHFYLNPIGNYTAASNYYAYEGVWEYRGVVYKIGVNYNKNTKAWTGGFHFIDDQTFIYHMDYYTTNYYKGAFSYVYGRDITNKNRKMTASFTKGEFPGMND